MTGIYLLFVVSIWLAVGIWLSKFISRKVPTANDETLPKHDARRGSRHRGGIPMRCLIHGALLTIAITALTGCTPEKDRLDAEAKRLCAIDGGIKVYETVTLPPEKFNQYGQPEIPPAKDDKGFGYYSKGTQMHLAGQISQLAGDGAGLKKHTTQIIRTADGKVMGESRVYGRHGGNLLDGYTQGGGYQCPTIEPWALENKVLLKGENK